LIIVFIAAEWLHTVADKKIPILHSNAVVPFSFCKHFRWRLRAKHFATGKSISPPGKQLQHLEGKLRNFGVCA